ncbi:hypothetical protein LMH87_009458 [Akanthomyces muscarius]|uniref:Uncharacterized protein n=1 Tax=Akanthomyces muscarius TaxID=2231603 RepID=A0A9W8QBY2_AKAMU|nr:hypothetical protein LMH87_009458 [Akanthomyces muscarius]KAJ4152941.1 hypothetical protein LMH87_009458 [Akanthomyces muscarius]
MHAAHSARKQPKPLDPCSRKGKTGSLVMRFAHPIPGLEAASSVAMRAKPDPARGFVLAWGAMERLRQAWQHGYCRTSSTSWLGEQADI